jgi:hypothetical protein
MESEEFYRERIKVLLVTEESILEALNKVREEIQEAAECLSAYEQERA